MCLGPRFRRAFEYLLAFSPDVEDGRYDLDGADDYVLVQTYETLPQEQRTFESHRRYVDVQYLFSGQETVYYRESSSLTVRAPYELEKDAIFYHDADDRPLHLGAGDFAVFWPQDAHKPACDWGKASVVRKVVVKVRLP